MPEILIILQSKLFEKSKCIINEEIIKIETIFDNFLIDKNYDFADEIINKSPHLPIFNLNLKDLRQYFKNEESNQKLNSINDELIKFNKYIQTFLSSVDLEHFQINTQVQNTFYFLFYFSNKALFYILSHPNFFFEDKFSNFLPFFENYRKVKHYTKLCLDSIISTDNNISDPSFLKKGYITSFSDIRNYKEEFKTIVEHCQHFLTLILFSIGSNNAENEQDEISIDKQRINLLEHFIKIFKSLFMINDEYKIIEYREFYNDGLSKNLNLKRECKIYLDILKKKYEGKKPFCLLSYMWLFDAAAKNDILQIFNGRKQTIELLNSIGGLQAGLFPFPRIINAQSAFFLLNVRRDNLIEDTLNAVSSREVNLQKQLKVKFVNEQGIDEGGVKKEFFLLLVRQLFDANYGMFNYNEKTRLFWFNMYSFEPKIKFELIGIILGLALFNNVILDIKFPLVIYKKLLDVKPELIDMKECDPELYNNLYYLKTTKDQNLKELLYTNFTVTNDKFGEKVVIPLKENGENIFIDNTNKDEYVDLFLDWYFNKSIEEFFKYFKTGFFRVCDKQIAPILRPEELELIICGTQILDFFELQKATKYEDGYKKNSITIKYFWEVLFEFSEDEKKKFLFFVTGCDRAPINGLGSLIITISRWGPDSDKLPTAHTCFNHLLIPDYQNKEKLKKNLSIAISNSEGFGLI